MNAPPPSPAEFTLDNWARLTAIVVGVVGLLVGAWRVIALPAIRWCARKVLQGEVDKIEHSGLAVARLWAEQLKQSEALREIRAEQREVRDIVMELSGRAGGRRRYDPP